MWTADFKLRFFVDISVIDKVVYAMGNKFMTSRIIDGKEVDTINKHREGVSFNANSTVLLSTSKVHFVGTSAGSVIRAEGDSGTSGSLVQCPHNAPITAVSTLILRHSS